MYKILNAALIVLLVSLSGHAWAANYSDPMDGIFKGIYGDTISIEVPSLVSKSPVSSENENGDLSFQLSANTGYRNFNQLTDLKVGDPVRVEYNNGKENQLVAVMITKLEPQVVANAVIVPGINASATPVTQTITTTTTTRVNSQ